MSVAMPDDLPGSGRRQGGRAGLLVGASRQVHPTTVQRNSDEVLKIYTDDREDAVDPLADLELTPETSKKVWREIVARTGPRHVRIWFSVKTIRNMAESGGSVDVDFSMTMQWNDPCMIDASKKGFRRTVAEYEQLWTPMLEINNSISHEELWDPDTSWNLKDDKTGLMMFSQRYVGKLSNFQDFHHFPLDQDAITINVGPKYYSTKFMRLEVIGVKCGLSEHANELFAWRFLDMAAYVLSKPTLSGSTFHNANITVFIARNSSYYFFKIISVQALVCLWNYSVFWIPAEDIEARSNTTLTLFLASVAFMFVANDSVPKLGYLTSMDKFSVMCFIMLFLSGLETAVVFWVHYWKGLTQLARDIDTIAVYAYIPIYLVVYAWEGIKCIFRRRVMKRQLTRLMKRLKVSSAEISLEEIKKSYGTIGEFLLR